MHGLETDAAVLSTLSQDLWDTWREEQQVACLWVAGLQCVPRVFVQGFPRLEWRAAGRHQPLEQLQFFSSEKIILLFDLFKKLAPFCRSAQLANPTCLEAARIIGSCSGHTPSVGQSQNLQGARDMLLVWLVPLSKCQCSS